MWVELPKTAAILVSIVEGSQGIIDQLLLIIIVMSVLHIHPRPTRTSTKNTASRNRIPQAAVCPSPESNEESCKQQAEVQVVEEQFKLRSEKETTSPIMQPIIAANINTADASRPLTRSCSLHSATATTDNYSPAEQPLALPHSLSIIQNATSLANTTVSSELQLPNDTAITPILRKNNSKNNESAIGGFGQGRKSYRKTNRSDISAFSYRKCHDALEGRVVALLNKTVVGKVLQKEVEALTDRIPKMGGKNLKNKYIISGINFTLRLGRESNLIEEKPLARLNKQYTKLQERIGESLDCFQEFQTEIHDEDDSVLGQQQRIQFIRRMYEIGKRNFPDMDRAQLRNKVVRQCEECFFRGQKHAGLLRYLRVEAGREER